MSEADNLVATIKAAMKAAMKAREKERLATIRLIQAEFKRVEVDERIDIDDARALTIMDKMVKQRRDSVNQFQSAGRDELAAIELAEIEVIQEFLPQQTESIYRQHFPEDKKQANLKNWGELEIKHPGIFGKTPHFWVSKS